MFGRKCRMTVNMAGTFEDHIRVAMGPRKPLCQASHYALKIHKAAAPLLSRSLYGASGASAARLAVAPAGQGQNDRKSQASQVALS